MKNETNQWLKYANENLESAIILCESFLYNPSLQYSQQSIEKYIKTFYYKNHVTYKLLRVSSFKLANPEVRNFF